MNNNFNFKKGDKILYNDGSYFIVSHENNAHDEVFVKGYGRNGKSYEKKYSPILKYVLLDSKDITAKFFRYKFELNNKINNRFLNDK